VIAEPGRVIDGDTFDAKLSLFLNLFSFERIRVLGVDTPELHAPTLAAAQDARAFSIQWLGKGPVQLTACKRDDFGRLLAIVTRGEENLATELIKAGKGVPR
jgi:endonuclease YncB( thermonuclease family)